METNKIFHLGDVNVSTYSDGSIKGFELKRLATIEEAREVIDSIFGIAVINSDDFGEDDEDLDDYDAYNMELTALFNEWLKGHYDDDAIMNYFGCEDDQLGLFNLLPLIIYLKEKEII